MNRIIAAIKNKIALLIGRAIITAITNDGKTQVAQVKGLKNEVISDIERIQEYGFESYPKAANNPEAIALFINGNRDQGLVIKVHDRDNRPTDLEEGDVAIWDVHGNKIYFTTDGIAIEDLNGNKADLTSDGIDIEDANGNTISTTSSKIEFNGTNFTVDQ